MGAPSPWEQQQQKQQNVGLFFFRVLYCDFSVTNFYLCPKQHMLCPISIFNFLYALPILFCPHLSFLDVYYYESTNLLLTFTFTVVRTVSTT